MTSPVRLLESTQTAATRELLRAGLAERPRPSALRSTALALGVATSALAATTSAAATASAAATVTVATTSAATLALKSLAIGTLLGLSLAGGATIASSFTTPSPAAPARTSSPTLPAVARQPPAPSPLTQPAEQAAPAAMTAAARPASAPKRVLEAATPAPSAPASASLPDGQSLTREIALIDGARRALATGDAPGALRQLDEHDGQARTGTLDREAQLLRVDALAHAGQPDAARALAERYLARYPNDPHAARLKALLAAP